MNNAADTTFTATEAIEILSDEFGFDADYAATFVQAGDTYTDEDIEVLAEMIEGCAA